MTRTRAADRPQVRLIWDEFLSHAAPRALRELGFRTTHVGAHDLNDALTTWSTSQRTVIGLAADFADSGEWMPTSAASAAHWIADVADIEVCTAREWIRVGRRLRVLPLIADLFEADELSYSKVRTLSRVANPENEQQLAAIAADVPAGALPWAITAWLHRTSNDAELERHQHEQRSVT